MEPTQACDSNDLSVSSSKHFLSRLVENLKLTTIEPATFLFMCLSLTNFMMYQNLSLEAICRVDLNNSAEYCHDVIYFTNTSGTDGPEGGTVENQTIFDETDCNTECEMQKIATKVRSYRSLIDNTLPIVLVLVLGPWSDRYGRKVPMLLPCVGMILMSAVYLIFAWKNTFSAYTIALVGAGTFSTFGGISTYEMAGRSFIADRTTKAERTVRIGIIQACSLIAVPVGMAIGGKLSTSSFNKVHGFAITTGLSVLCFLNILLVVDNKKLIKKHSTTNIINDAKEQVIVLCTFPFKKREDGGRIKMLLLLIAYIGAISPNYGEFGIMYLFLRKEFGWEIGKYTNFSIYNFVIGVAGTVLSLAIFSHGLKMYDALLGFITGMSQFSACFIYAFATSSLMLYSAPLVDMMNGTMGIISLSMLSKIVACHEHGTLFSLVGLLNILTPLAMDSIYNQLYKNTLEYRAGSFFLLSAALTIPPQLIFLWFVYRNSKKSNNMNTDSKLSEVTPKDKCEDTNVDIDVIYLNKRHSLS